MENNSQNKQHTPNTTTLNQDSVGD